MTVWNVQGRDKRGCCLSFLFSFSSSSAIYNSRWFSFSQAMLLCSEVQWGSQGAGSSGFFHKRPRNQPWKVELLLLPRHRPSPLFFLLAGSWIPQISPSPTLTRCHHELIISPSLLLSSSTKAPPAYLRLVNLCPESPSD